jgi:hypothetical protein
VISDIAEIRIQLLPVEENKSTPNEVPVTHHTNNIHEDALQIRSSLMDATTEGQVRVIIFEWFGKYFGEEIMGDEWASLKDSTLDLWKWYGR